jgi:hypothetical protein
MKRNSLTTAVVAGIAGTVGIANLASAVNLNPDGLGQVLIYPYYTVNDNGSGKELQTLFSVVNTTDQGKAVKVRFVEGYNSREVRDFHVYLSPYDVWTATLFKHPEEEQANLVTYDTSCTVPQIRGAGGSRPELGTLPNGASFLRFTNARYSGSFADGGPTGLARTREGHFEVIEMGVVTNADRNSLNAITHVIPASGGVAVPRNCAQVVGAWVAQPAGYWTTNPNIDIDPPTGGLFGSALIVDVATGVSAGYSADAIDGFIPTGTAGNLHAPPGNVEPSLAQVGGVAATSVTAYVFNNGDLIQATYGTAGSNKIDAVSALFTQDNIFNEYVLDGGAGATTDWVVTFPTKRFYVDTAVVGNTARAPFAEVFKAYNGAGTGESKVIVGLFPFDREEQTPESCSGSDQNNPNCGVCFSPCDEATFEPPVLRYEAQVISFKTAAEFEENRTSTVLGSQLASNVDVRADGLSQGWLRLAFNTTAQAHLLSPSSEGEVFAGLPATGFAITNYVNANAAPGRLANYSGLWHHKGSRSCVATGGAACS